MKIMKLAGQKYIRCRMHIECGRLPFCCIACNQSIDRRHLLRQRIRNILISRGIHVSIHANIRH